MQQSFPAGGRPPHQSPLQPFADQVHPDALAEVLAWRDDPELHSLHVKLRSHTERKPFFDTWAEAMVARHLRSRGCTVAFEVPTPHDRRADFEVQREGLRFCLHLKRIDTDRPAHRHLVVSSRLRVLERIRQPYVVQVRWHEGLTDDQMQLLVQQAEPFIQSGHVGDEMVARDHDGREIGGVRIVAPHSGQWGGGGGGPRGGGGGAEHVSVTIGLPEGFIDLSPRMRRLLRRAHEQFMPKTTNVIMLACNHDEDIRDFESALLGSHIERWDQFPPRGKRIAHGRAPDGFWHARRYADSAFAVWMKFAPREDSFTSRLYVRKELQPDEAVAALLRSLFECE